MKGSAPAKRSSMEKEPEHTPNANGTPITNRGIPQVMLDKKDADAEERALTKAIHDNRMMAIEAALCFPFSLEYIDEVIKNGSRNQIRNIFSYFSKEEYGIDEEEAAADMVIETIRESEVLCQGLTGMDKSKVFMDSLLYVDSEGATLHKGIISGDVLDGWIEMLKPIQKEIKRISEMLLKSFKESGVDKKDYFKMSQEIWDDPTKCYIEEVHAAMVRLSQEHKMSFSEIKRKAQTAVTKNIIFKEKKGELVQRNISISKNRARRYGRDTLDLIQEGNLGLIRAAEKFYYLKGFKFSTYAIHWVKQGVKKGASDQKRTVKIPSHILDKWNHIMRVRDNMLANGEDASIDNISETIGWEKEEVQKILMSMTDSISMDAPISNDDECSTIGDFLPSDDSLEPERIFVQKQLEEEIEDSLKLIPAREAEVIRQRFGIGYDRRLTLEEIGEQMGITREWVRQLQTHGIKAMSQAALHKGKLKEFLE